MANANAIGSGYEREIVNFLNLELGQAFSRNPYNQQKKPAQADVVCDWPNFPFAIECKKYAKSGFCDLRPAWWQQACNAADEANKLPAVFYRYKGQSATTVAICSNALTLGGYRGGSNMPRRHIVKTDLDFFCYLAREIMAGAA